MADGGGAQNLLPPPTHRAYRDAGQLLAAAASGAFPPDEAQWLVATCWNRAALSVRQHRWALAESLVKTTMEVHKHAVRHCRGLDPGMPEKMQAALVRIAEKRRETSKTVGPEI